MKKRGEERNGIKDWKTKGKDRSDKERKECKVKGNA